MKKKKVSGIYKPVKLWRTSQSKMNTYGPMKDLTLNALKSVIKLASWLSEMKKDTHKYNKFVFNINNFKVFLYLWLIRHKSKNFIVAESVPRPIQSISCNIFCCLCVCLSPPRVPRIAWTGDYWSKSVLLKLLN